MKPETEPEPDTRRRLLLVVGLDRDGMGLLAGMLGQLGFHVPQPEAQAGESKPRGLDEPRWVLDFHTTLMRERRVTLFDARPAARESTAAGTDDDEVFEDLRSWLAVQFVGTESVVVNDPRSGWFLPLWLRAADALGIQLSVVMLLRHPLDVVARARSWYGTSRKDASRAAGWVNVTLHAELATRATPRAFVRYEDLVEDSSRQIALLAGRLDVPWLKPIEGSEGPDIQALLDAGRSSSTQARDDVSLPSALRAMAEDVWRHVSRLPDLGPDGDDTRSSLDHARAAYDELYEGAEAIAESSVAAAGAAEEPRRTTGPPASQADRPREPTYSLVRIARRISRRYRPPVPPRIRRLVRSLRGPLA